MKIIKPITIDDDIFTASNVPEDDLQEFESGTAYAVGDTVMVATSTANVHKTYECVIAQSAGLAPDLLNEDCSDISDWTLNNYGGTSTIEPTGQFKFNTGIVSSVVNGDAYIYRSISNVPDTFTMEIKTYFDALGSVANDAFQLSISHSDDWTLKALWRSDGLFIFKAAGATTNVGASVVKCNAGAVWQTWRFEVTKTVHSTATVDIYVKEDFGIWESLGTFDCDWEPSTGGSGSTIIMAQYGYDTDSRITHVDYLKIATGLGVVRNSENSPAGNTNWLELESTNRWKAFNEVLGSQTEQATKIEYVLTPGEVIDSLALMNLESDTVDIVLIDSADQLILNNDWTDATGTTQPTSWDKVGTPANFTIETAALKITSDANGEGISQTIAVSAATEYQLVFKYKNTASDIAQVAIYDVTNSADILATTDLTSATANASYSKVFTIPAGCVSIKISLLCKTSGDIVWFEEPYLCPTEYSDSVTTGASKTDVVKLDIPEIATGILTVTINKTGTAAIGEIVLGNSATLGTMKYSPQIGITNYSTKIQDTFGNWTIVPRGYSKRLAANIRLQNTSLDAVFKLFSDYKDGMLVWIGSEDYSALIVYGFWKDFQIVIPYKNFADCSVEIEGMI